MDAAKVPDHRLSVSCILGKAEPIMADDGARANGATASYRHPVHHYHVVPDDRIISNGDLSIQRAVVADADIASQFDPGTDIRALPDGGPGLILSVKMLDGTEKRPLALCCADHVGRTLQLHIGAGEHQRQRGEIKVFRHIFQRFDPGERAGAVVGQGGKALHLGQGIALKGIRKLHPI